MSEEEIYATLVEIREEPTALYKILKIANLVSGGGEAKQVIAEGYVYLNGEVETQKRKKIYAGDQIYFNEQYLQVAILGEAGEYEVVDDAALEQAGFQSSQDQLVEDLPNAAQPVEASQPAKTKGKKPRRSISF